MSRKASPTPTPWKTCRPFVYRDKRTYRWRKNGVRWELLAESRVVAKLAPDEMYAGMRRIDLGDGALSDMVNLSRARDAAVRMAEARIGKKLSCISPMRNRAAGTRESLTRQDASRTMAPHPGPQRDRL
jgi:hypothetical protein